MSPNADPILARWLAALQEFQPGLPQPVALAMVEGAERGPLGQSLCHIEEALIHLDRMALENLTGSELRVTLAILQQLNQELAQLHVKLNGLWEKP